MTLTLFISKAYNKTLGKLFSVIIGLIEVGILAFFKKKDEIILIMSNPLGDCVYGLAYANALKINKQKNLIIISDRKRKRLIESYKIEAKIISLEGTSREWKWTQYLNGSRLCVLIAMRLGIYNIVPWVVCSMKKYKDSNALDLIRDKLFHLPNTAKIAYPDFSNEPIKSIPDFEKNKNRIAIINPYSTSMDDVDFEFFNQVSLKLIHRGYIVYTNVVGNQKAVTGGEKLCCPIEEFYAICNQVPLVVSVRSGIIDFTISANTIFYIVYFLCQFKGISDGFAGQYALNAWKTNNVEEIVYSDIDSNLAYFENFLNKHNF